MALNGHNHQLDRPTPDTLLVRFSSPAAHRRKRKARGAKRPAQHRKWLSSYYRITLSARASTLGGIVTPICLAVLRLITNSNFVGCSTGISAGFVPFRILSIITAARLNGSTSSAP